MLYGGGVSGVRGENKKSEVFSACDFLEKADAEREAGVGGKEG